MCVFPSDVCVFLVLHYLNLPLCLTNAGKAGSSRDFGNLFLRRPVTFAKAQCPGLPFGNELWQVFDGLGIRFEERCDKPFLSPYRRDGDLASRSITTGEVTSFLQLFLSFKGFDVGNRQITSHSLKHTGLSWVGKYGMTKEDQCVLGHHSDSVRGTEAVYSYDLSIGAVQRFEVLLHYIASGEFVPDEPRSKFWKFPPVQVCQSLPPLMKLTCLSAHPEWMSFLKPLLLSGV